MLLSRTSEYALQALIYLAAQPPGKPVLNREVARYLGVPAPYLTKILKDLGKRGLVLSQKGRGGGYLAAPAVFGTSIREVVELVDGPAVFQGCLLGLKTCSDATACPVHHTWAPLKLRLLELLSHQTVGGMAEAVRSGRYRVTDLLAARRSRGRRR
jgi:Rrf2 family protein